MTNLLILFVIVSISFILPYLFFYNRLKKRLNEETISFEDYKNYVIKIFGIYFFILFLLQNWQNILLLGTAPEYAGIIFKKIFIGLAGYILSVILAILATFLTFKILKINNKEDLIHKKTFILVIVSSVLLLIEGTVIGVLIYFITSKV